MQKSLSVINKHNNNSLYWRQSQTSWLGSGSVYGLSDVQKRSYTSQVEVFWVVMPCCVVVGYQRFRGPCSLQLQVEVFRFVTPCNNAVGCQSFRGPCCLHPKYWYSGTKLRGVGTQMTSIWIFTTVKASNLATWIILQNASCCVNILNNVCLLFFQQWKESYTTRFSYCMQRPIFS